MRAWLFVLGVFATSPDLKETDAPGEAQADKQAGRALESPREQDPDQANSYFLRPGHMTIPPTITVEEKDKKPAQAKPPKK